MSINSSIPAYVPTTQEPEILTPQDLLNTNNPALVRLASDLATRLKETAVNYSRMHNRHNRSRGK